MIGFSRVLLASAVAAVVVFGAKWDQYNNPLNVKSSYKLKLSELPLQGELTQEAWSDTYWPSFESGIAHRWAKEDPEDFKYKLYTLEELKNMTLDQLKELSPAEKYDLYRQKYDYPTVKAEWKRTSKDDPEWEGICHGWAPAALSYKEPQPFTVKNEDGLEVPFGSSDLKALLSYFDGQYNYRGETWFAGQRCNENIDENPAAANNPECLDMNAGAFHVILANQIGLLQEGFVVDRDRSYAVWNQPVTTFTATVSELQAPLTTGANASVKVNLKYGYSKETYPQWKAHTPYTVYEYYDYTLDLDAEGNIIGGDQQTNDRVDFAWHKQATPFWGYWTGLQALYALSTNDNSLNATTPAPLPLLNFERVQGSRIEVLNYEANDLKVWAVYAEDPAATLTFKFNSFETEKFRDLLRIYEGADEVGPLVASLSGKLDYGFEVKVAASSALLVFKSDHVYEFPGFSVEYYSTVVA